MQELRGIAEFDFGRVLFGVRVAQLVSVVLLVVLCIAEVKLDGVLVLRAREVALDIHDPGLLL
jgi:hypothetical protein